jgi:hypothetical protein
MKTKKFKFILPILTITLLALIYIANPGYHFTSCTCSYRFKLIKDKYDCAQYCNEEEKIPLDKIGEMINKILLTDLIKKLKTIDSPHSNTL